MGRNRTLPDGAIQQTVHLSPKAFDLLNAICHALPVGGNPTPRTTVARTAVEIGLEQLAKEMGIDPDNPPKTSDQENPEVG